MDKLINNMLYIQAIVKMVVVFIFAIVAYFTILRKMDHNLQVRNIVFKIIISILLGSVVYSVLSPFMTAFMVSTRAIATPVYSLLSQILGIILYLGIGAVFYWSIRNISMSFGYSHKQYEIIKLITALMLGWIAKDVIWLIMIIVYAIFTVILNV
jgi:hypothetical protein